MLCYVPSVVLCIVLWLYHFLVYCYTWWLVVSSICYISYVGIKCSQSRLTVRLCRCSSLMYHACWCLWASTSTACIPTPNMVRHGTYWQNCAVERGLVVGFSMVNHSIVTDPTTPQPGFNLPRHTGLCSTISGQAKVHAWQICTNGVLPNHLPVIVASHRP